MGNISISIIVPVYNAEAYVAECLSSIQAQTFKDWECICVDDGSSDESPSIVEKFAAKDARFRLIQQKNSGPGPARNTGLKAAQGEYFTFVDADDLLHPQMLERLLGLARAHAVDLVVCDFVRFKSSDEFWHMLQHSESLMCNSDVHTQPLLPQMVDWRKFRPEAWGKLYLRVHHCHLRFPRLRRAQDLYASYDVYARSTKMAFSWAPLYGYRVVETGLTQTLYKYRNYLQSLPETTAHGEAVLKKHGVKDALRKKILIGWIMQIFFIVNSMSTNLRLSSKEKRELMALAVKGLRYIKRSVDGNYRTVPLVHYVPYCALCLRSLRLLILWQWVRSHVLSHLRAKRSLASPAAQETIQGATVQTRSSQKMELLEPNLPMAHYPTDPAQQEHIGIRGSAENFEVPTRQSAHPLVSVIIPTYNRSWALGKSVGSVLEQTYRPIECVIIDDGSTDDTSDVVKRLIRKCPEGVRIRYYKKENGGVNSARNRGLAECRGEFICYLDSDDMLVADSIYERARVLIGDPDVDFCYGLSSTRDEHGNETGRMNTSWPTSDEARISRYLFHTNSPLIRRSTCARVGLWRVDDSYGDEYEYFSRLKYFSNKVLFINKVLSVYVRHNNERIFTKSISNCLSIFKSLLIVKALVLYGKYDNKQERRQLSRAFRSVAKRLFDLKDYSNASAALQESLILKFNLKVFAQWLVIKVMAIVKKYNQIKRK